MRKESYIHCQLFFFNSTLHHLVKLTRLSAVFTRLKQGYQRATLITQGELNYIKAVDKKTGEDLSRVVDQVYFDLCHQAPR